MTINQFKPEDLEKMEAMSDDTLGDRISLARSVSGLSTAELAPYIGVEEETLLAWEKDEDEPRANKLVMLAGIMSVSPAWLLAGE